VEAVLEEAVLACERGESTVALPTLEKIANETNGMGARLFYADCLRRKGSLVKARKNCELVVERAQILAQSAQTKKEEDNATRREHEARECIRNLDSRIPNLQVFVSGTAADAANVWVNVNGKPLDSALWGRPIPMDPGTCRLTGRAFGEALEPMTFTIVEGKLHPVQIVLPLPVKLKVHSPSLYQGVGVGFFAVGLTSLGFGAYFVERSRRIEDSAPQNVVLAAGLGFVGLAMFGVGGTFFGLGARDAWREKQREVTVAFALTSTGFAVKGRF
jgi:hypothetical protein